MPLQNHRNRRGLIHQARNKRTGQINLTPTKTKDRSNKSNPTETEKKVDRKDIRKDGMTLMKQGFTGQA